jgi:hypothetical protein
MPAPANSVEQAVVDGATSYLDTYKGTNKFLNDLIGKRQRIDGFQLSVRQAEVVMKIADELHARDDEAPF